LKAVLLLELGGRWNSSSNDQAALQRRRGETTFTVAHTRAAVKLLALYIALYIHRECLSRRSSACPLQQGRRAHLPFRVSSRPEIRTFADRNGGIAATHAINENH